ncbi:hypothetical protein EJB05_05998, partial [Eragrostis curvula]
MLARPFLNGREVPDAQFKLRSSVVVGSQTILGFPLKRGAAEPISNHNQGPAGGVPAPQGDGGQQPNAGAPQEVVSEAPANFDINALLGALPAQAAALLQQAFAAAANNNMQCHIPESSAQGAARGAAGKTKAPYCYRCLTKGHVIDDCHTDVHCDICESDEHSTTRCPLFRSMNKPYATPCGYAVQGLGFYYIPHSVSPKIKNDPRTALIKVIEGSLSVENVVAELERLNPGKWKWVVEKYGQNMFTTMFPSKAELQRMIEWGVVHTKSKDAKMVIEGKGVCKEVKSVLPKVWVQFHGLPKELRDFMVIWAVGSILGVTKIVDMKFTKEHNICRMQVLVLDPSLIPQHVDVVIGDYLYDLQFRVGPIGNNAQPLDFDDDIDEDNDGNGKDKNGMSGKGNDNSQLGGAAGSNGATEEKGKQATGPASSNSAPGQSGAKERMVVHLAIPGIVQVGQGQIIDKQAAVAELVQDGQEDEQAARDVLAAAKEAAHVHVITPTVASLPALYEQNLDDMHMLAGQEPDSQYPAVTDNEHMIEDEEYNEDDEADDLDDFDAVAELTRNDPKLQQFVKDLEAIPEATTSPSRKSKRSEAVADVD